MSGLRISPFISMIIGLLFTFSTAYGIIFYFMSEDSKAMPVQGLSSNPNDPTSISTSGGFLQSFVTGIFDNLLSLLAWISPFALIRALFLAVTDPTLFQILDIFLFRPMSWAVSILTANWIIAKVRGTSEGT